MIDKLCFKTKQDIDLARIDSFLSENSSYSFYTTDKNYNSCKVFKKDSNHLATLKYNPKIRSIALTTVETNPNRHDSFELYLDIFQSIIDDTFYISRIDLAVDLNIPIFDVYTSVSIKHKRNKTCYREGGRVTGFDVGSNNELFCIYDKAYERVRACKYTKKNTNTNTLTRFEARLKNQKVPFNSISEIKLYKDHYPFTNLTFYKLKDDLPKRLEGAKNFSDTLGMNSLIKQLSKSNNFRKSNSKYLERTNLEQVLKDSYLLSINNQLGGINE